MRSARVDARAVGASSHRRAGRRRDRALRLRAGACRSRRPRTVRAPARGRRRARRGRRAGRASRRRPTARSLSPVATRCLPRPRDLLHTTDCLEDLDAPIHLRSRGARPRSRLRSRVHRRPRRGGHRRRRTGDRWRRTGRLRKRGPWRHDDDLRRLRGHVGADRRLPGDELRRDAGRLLNRGITCGNGATLSGTKRASRRSSLARRASRSWRARFCSPAGSRSTCRAGCATAPAPSAELLMQRDGIPLDGLVLLDEDKPRPGEDWSDF